MEDASGPAEAHTAFIGIGSNLDGPAAQVRRALEELAALPDTRLERASALYRTPPLGPPAQPDYINAVARLVTGLAPHPLLDALQAIEQAHGRVRGERWGPRTLDLDLLVYDAVRIADDRLTVPHPGIGERSFVLTPLAEIAPDWDVPGLGPAAAALARAPFAPARRL